MTADVLWNGYYLSAAWLLVVWAIQCRRTCDLQELLAALAQAAIPFLNTIFAFLATMELIDEELALYKERKKRK